MTFGDGCAGLTYGAEYFGIVDQDAGLLEASKAVDAIQVVWRV